RLRQASQFLPCEDDLSGCWSLKLQDAAANGRLTAPRLPNQTEGLPLVYGEAHTVHGPHRTNSPGNDTCPHNGKMLHEVLHLENDGAGGGHGGASLPSCSATQHAERCSAPTRISGGTSS